MVSYTLPGMTEFPDLNLLFLSFYRDARDIFFDDVAIESVYGGFPGSPLCGGRNNLGEAISLGDVENALRDTVTWASPATSRSPTSSQRPPQSSATRTASISCLCSMSNRPTATCLTG